jgi:hypothetical protein
MRRCLIALVALPALAGCAELRTEYAPATGDPMHVYDKTVLKTGTQQVATGHDEVRDAQGNVVATNTHYENQQISWTEREWFPMQGGGRVDDESFYRITGDQEAVQKYESYHQAGVSRNTAGFVIMGIGLGVFGGSLAAYVADAPKTDPKTGIAGDRSALSTVGYIGMTAGLITAVVGTLMIFSGKHAAHAEDARLFDEPERMKADAMKYNDNLSMTAAGGGAPTPAPTPSPAAGPLVAQPGASITIAPISLTLSKEKVKKVELKSDGSIMADGKKVGMISGAMVKDTSGGTLFTVLADGSLKGDDLPNSNMRMVGDELVRGDKRVTVADDGTIVIVSKGSVETVGKIDKGGRQKRTAVLMLAAVAASQRQ